MVRRFVCLLGLLITLAAPAFAQPAPSLTIQRSDQPAIAVTPERLAAIPTLTQTVTFEPARGGQPITWSGPLLWTVLEATGVVEGIRAADTAKLMVRVIGADGYFAVFALAELAPSYANRPIQLALRQGETSLPGGARRLVVPGEGRAGRSVRDVVRIEIQ